MANLHRCKPVLGTYVDISLSADVPDAVLLQASDLAFSCLQNIHDLMSFHDPKSELSKINRTAFGCSVAISPSTHTVLKTALEISTLSGGLYDITIARQLMDEGRLPRHNYAPEAGDWTAIKLQNNLVEFEKNITIDLGGIAKGYAVDVAFESLCELKIPFTQITINAGGDLRMLNWRDEKITLRAPTRWRKTRFVMCEMQNTALATSVPGRGSSSSFIRNPLSNKNTEKLKAISVFSSSCMVADALTKLMYLDPTRIDILERYSASAVYVQRGKVKAITSETHND